MNDDGADALFWCIVPPCFPRPAHIRRLSKSFCWKIEAIEIISFTDKEVSFEWRTGTQFNSTSAARKKKVREMCPSAYQSNRWKLNQLIGLAIASRWIQLTHLCCSDLVRRSLYSPFEMICARMECVVIIVNCQRRCLGMRYSKTCNLIWAV